MDSALIVSQGEKGVAFLTEMLTLAVVSNVSAVQTAEEARRHLLDMDYDLCVILAPLPDESGVRLAENIAGKGLSEVILIVKAEQFEEVSGQVEDRGVLTVSKPVNKALFWNAIKMAHAAHQRFQILQNEKRKLLQKIEDLRVIDRAKCLLISYLSMTEPEAHKYIERQAMDMRVTRRDVAEEILRTYER
jgi:response regulator NasT